MAGFFDTDGRLNRGRFAVQYFALLLTALPASLLLGFLDGFKGQLWLFYLIAFIVVGISLFTIFPIIKRFHDLGHSGWWTLTTWLPLVGLVSIIYLLFWRGTVGPNQYGHDPLGAAKDISIRARPVEPAKSLPHSFGPPSTTAQAASPIPANSPPASMPLSHTNTPAAMSQGLYVIDEEAIYEEIANELENGATDKGLWTRLFAECGGDEKQTKVHYIKRRAEKLISAERTRLEQEASERAAEAERIEKLRPPPSDTQQMEEYGITFDGERYAYREYKYDRLSDAIRYAKLQTSIEAKKNGLREIEQLLGLTAFEKNLDEDVRLLELMGGKFKWVNINLCENCMVEYVGQSYDFSDGRVFRQWISSTVFPEAKQLLAISPVV